MKPQHLLAGLAAAIIALCWLTWPEPPPETLPSAPPLAQAPAAAPAAAAAAGRAWLSELPVKAETPAWQSMAEARANGDDRAPPLQEDTVRRIAPTAAQLADPAAYRAFEKSQHARVLAAFAAAAEAELPKLKADVERARLAGIPPEQIARVEKKILRLEATRRAIAETGAVPE